MASRGLITSGRMLAAAIVLSVIGSFVPTRSLGFVGGVSRVVTRLASPVRDGGKLIGDLLSRAERAEHPSPEIGRLEDLESLVRKQELTIGDLRSTIADLEQGLTIPSDRVRQLSGRVFSTAAARSSRTLSVKRGTRDGVVEGAIATAKGRHMLGRVSSVTDAYCTVTPITDPNFGAFEVMVYPAGQSTNGVRFTVSPMGDGTLRGAGQFVTEGDEQRPRQVEAGVIATLSDPAMSPHWGLIVGDVVSVERDESSPLRQVITVRPQLDTRRVYSVVLRIPENEDGGP